MNGMYQSLPFLILIFHPYFAFLVILDISEQEEKINTKFKNKIRIYFIYWERMLPFCWIKSKVSG